MGRYDIIPIIFWLGLSLFGIILSYNFGLGELHNPGPGLMPFSLSVLIFIVSFYLLLRHLSKRSDKGEPVKEAQSQIDFWKIVIVVVLLFAYALVLEKLGYLIATFVLVTLLYKYSGMKRWSFALIGSALTTLVTYFIFTYLGLNFPKGFLWWI